MLADAGATVPVLPDVGLESVLPFLADSSTCLNSLLDFDIPESLVEFWLLC